ncbi:MAG: tRNA lysidine(34) synthetase TilS [Longicatena sp.]
MDKLKLDHKKTYVIGVSGGPDSMALFDMCVKAGIHVIAAHMNYQKRDSATRDMEIVEDYCKQHRIIFEKRMQNKECEGNFQAFARDMRYQFYKEVLDKYQGDAVLLAHQLDDHLETYIMQKQSLRLGVYYGIQGVCEVMGCKVIRPLLAQTKADLEAYCEENGVAYGIDESNLSNHYTRNKIRHEMIEHMSIDEKIALAKQIDKENEAWTQLCTRAKDFLKGWDKGIASYIALEEELALLVLTFYIFDECHIHETLVEVKQIHNLIHTKANQWTRDIAKEYRIYSEYEKLCIDKKAHTPYCFKYAELTLAKTPYFEVSNSGSSVEAVTLYKEDFPITIRSYIEGDEIRMRFGVKKLNRWFIDRKIPKKERKNWPVVVNASGNVILVPKLGCDIEHFSNNPTCFVLK